MIIATRIVRAEPVRRIGSLLLINFPPLDNEVSHQPAGGGATSFSPEGRRTRIPSVCARFAEDRSHRARNKVNQKYKIERSV